MNVTNTPLNIGATSTNGPAGTAPLGIANQGGTIPPWTGQRTLQVFPGQKHKTEHQLKRMTDRRDPNVTRAFLAKAERSWEKRENASATALAGGRRPVALASGSTEHFGRLNTTAPVARTDLHPPGALTPSKAQELLAEVSPSNPQTSGAGSLFWGSSSTDHKWDEKDPMGRGGVLMLEEYRADGGKVAKALQSFAGENNVHVVPSTAVRQAEKRLAGERVEEFSVPRTPYLRNIVAEGPNSMLVPSKVPSQYEGTLKDVVKELGQMGVTVAVAEGMINFANIDWQPAADLLVMADAKWGITPAMRPAVEKMFGNPKNVIHFRLNEAIVNRLGSPLCYDADLSFHALRNPAGQCIAMYHRGCLQKAPDGSDMMDASEVEKTLKALNFSVIHVSAADQELLATNSLSLHGTSGKLQMSHPGVSADLLNKLREHGITPVLPDEVLGVVTSWEPSYGIHCLTVSLRLPEGKETPEATISTWGTFEGVLATVAVTSLLAFFGAMATREWNVPKKDD